jgi:radical SAM superfamily enzyme YgiQ (UPF0313 family)
MKRKASSKRVLLIDPKGFGAGLNLGLAYLAAVLLKNGYQVRVVDCNNDPIRLAEGARIRLRSFHPEDWHKKIERVLRWKPAIIGISINSFSLNSAIEIIKYCRQKSKLPAVYLAGGPHVAMFQKSFLEKHKELFDFALVGEAEETIVELLKNLKSPKKVKGIMYYDAKKREVVQTEARPLIADLDSLPMPNFEVFDTVDPEKGLSSYQMISSRGCPYKCVFCFHMWDKRWRARSAENVIAELKYAIKKYKIRLATFWDDNFTLDISRAKKICDLLISEKLNLNYTLAGIRADRIDEELARKLKESGCIGISMGIEDGDPATALLVEKGETLTDIKGAVKLIKKHRIPLLAYMVTGLINSSYKSFLRSLKFIESLDVAAHWSIAFPFPMTPLFEWAKKNGRFLMTLEQGFQYSMTNKDPPVVFDTPTYSKEERLKAYFLGNLRCKSYDMLMSSRDGNLFLQAYDILAAIIKYDRKRFWWHLSNLVKIIFQSGLGICFKFSRVLPKD